MIFIYLIGAIALLILVLSILHKLGVIDALHQDLSRAEVIQILQSFVDGTDNDYDLDDFLSVDVKDPELDKVRQRVESLPFDYGAKGELRTGTEWKRSVQKILDELRSEGS